MIFTYYIESTFLAVDRNQHSFRRINQHSLLCMWIFCKDNWHIPPPDSLYIPQCWLASRNTIIIRFLHGNKACVRVDGYSRLYQTPFFLNSRIKKLLILYSITFKIGSNICLKKKSLQKIIFGFLFFAKGKIRNEEKSKNIRRKYSKIKKKR